MPLINPGADSAAGPENASFRAPLPRETTIFVVDDHEDTLGAMGRHLDREDYDVTTFADPEAALAAIRGQPPMVLVVDQQMHDTTGLQLAERALESDPGIGVIVIAGEGDSAAAQGALRIGASDYLIKPFDLATLSASVRRSVLRLAEAGYHRSALRWLRDEVKRKSEAHDRLILGVLSVLVNTLEARWEHFAGHSGRVSEVAQRIARAHGLPADEVERIRVAGLLHDIGMISVPDRVVEKEGDLTPEEYWELQLHCQRAADILDPLDHFQEATRFVLEHHERIDGSGYPLGLQGEAISLGGQIVGVAESWVAVIEDRPFRKGQSKVEAFRTLSAQAGTRFSTDLIEALGVAEGIG